MRCLDVYRYTTPDPLLRFGPNVLLSSRIFCSFEVLMVRSHQPQSERKNIYYGVVLMPTQLPKERRRAPSHVLGRIVSTKDEGIACTHGVSYMRRQMQKSVGRWEYIPLRASVVLIASLQKRETINAQEVGNPNPSRATRVQVQKWRGGGENFQYLCCTTWWEGRDMA